MKDLKYNKLLELPTNILQVVAHPDDEIIYGGGLMTLNQAVGGISHVVCLGGAESDNPLRKREFEHSCHILGLSGKLLGLEEGNYSSLETKEKLGELIRLYEPNFLLTHSNYDFHTDHHATRELSKQAALNESSRTKGHQLDGVLYSEGYTPHLLPEVHTLIDVSYVANKVLEALDSHNSQDGIDYYKEVLNTRWKLRGIQAGCEQAEAFFIEPLLISTRVRVPNYSDKINIPKEN